MKATYVPVMSSQASRTPLRRLMPLLVVPLLAGCSLSANFSPLSPLERQVNGLYEGVGLGPTGRVPYRLVLTVQPRSQQASGVLTNLSSRKTYTLSGTYRPLGEALVLDTALFENGNEHRGNLRADWQAGTLSGQLRTVLFGKELLTYRLDLKRVAAADGTSNDAGNTPADTTAPGRN